MKRSIYIITLSILLVFFLSLDKGKTKSVSGPNRVTFGVKIGLLPTGQLTQFSLFYFKDDQLIGSQAVELNRLIKIGTGEWPIPRTTTFKNIFEEQGILIDTLPDGKVVDYNSAFDSLWKIRFEAHPYKHELGNGWSQGEVRPSIPQQVYIYNRYGVRGYDQDYFIDTSFFKLMRDVIDPTWINNYKSLR